jgi:hypothetical protein
MREGGRRPLWIGCNLVDFNGKINYYIVVVSYVIPFALSLDLGGSQSEFSFLCWEICRSALRSSLRFSQDFHCHFFDFRS